VGGLRAGCADGAAAVPLLQGELDAHTKEIAEVQAEKLRLMRQQEVLQVRAGA
jgi:hypothetical protein